MAPSLDRLGPRFVLVDDDGAPSTTLVASRRDTLFEVLTRAGIPFCSRCGGSSICGTCWVEVVDEDLPPAPDEAALLARNAAQAVRPRLACRLRIPADREEVRVRLRKT